MRAWKGGFTEQLIVDGKLIRHQPTGTVWRDGDPALLEKFRQLGIVRALILGDWDAAWMYHAVETHGTRLIWAWNFGCNQSEPRRVDVLKQGQLFAWRRASEIEYWHAVSSTEDVIMALEKSAR